MKEINYNQYRQEIKNKFFKDYMKNLFVKVPLAEQEVLKGLIPSYDNYVIFGDREALHKAGNFFLLYHCINESFFSDGVVKRRYSPKNYRFIKAGDLTAKFISSDYETSNQYRNLSEELLIIYHNNLEYDIGNYKTNIEKVALHTITDRMLEGKKTIYLCEVPNLDYLKNIDGVKVVDLSKELCFVLSGGRKKIKPKTNETIKTINTEGKTVGVEHCKSVNFKPCNKG